MATDAEWTIDELAQLAGSALAVDYAGAPNGRVREVPDRRTIRWYATIGLLDRPAAMRGRTALYGRRHLMQLVAVKRLQARGRSIAEVQQDLLGADEDTLAEYAQLPADLQRPRFWAARPAAAPTPPSVDVVPSLRLGPGVTLVLSGAIRHPDAADLDAIGQAATALLDVLADRGLLAHTNEGGTA